MTKFPTAPLAADGARGGRFVKQLENLPSDCFARLESAKEAKEAMNAVNSQALPAICDVCKQPLNLTRREVQQVVAAVRSVVKDRFFVPADEVHQIVHKVHTEIRT